MAGDSDSERRAERGGRRSVRARWSGALRRFGRREDGTVALEFVILAPVYFLMIFAIFELAMVSFVATTLKAGVSEASRQVKVGNAQCFQDQDAINAICDQAFLTECAARLQISRATFPLGWGGAASSTAFGSVDPGDIVLLRATYDWPIMTPIVRPFLGDDDGKLPLSRSLVFKTEEFVTTTC